jgi:phosphoenolpyruvate synthase/pyruvate phosphate dikinase
MNEYERSECYELLRKIIEWDSMLKDNQKDMDELISYLRTLEQRQYSKYIQAINEECKDLENEDED